MGDDRNAGRVLSITTRPSGHATATGLHYLARRLEAGARHLHELGPRALAEFLAQIGGDYAVRPGIMATLEMWPARLTPRLLRAAGAEVFPTVPAPVPAEDEP